jgi:hypothetical protein
VQQDRSDSTGRLRLEFIEQPLPGDEVGESEGMRMFVASDIAEVLASQTIDSSEGSNLVLREQGDLDEP